MSEPNRTLIASLALSAAALVGIAVDEGYSARAVPDAVHGKTVPTNGFGTTGRDIKLGDATAPVPALRRMLLDVQGFEGALKGCVKAPLYQYEYDAYVNLSYNIGASAFCNSTIVKKLNALDYAGACDAILMWRWAGDVDCSAPANRSCRGLWQRRLDLQRQCKGEAQP